MKAFLILLAPCCVFADEPRILTLAYTEGNEADYPLQIQTKFKQLLDSDKKLAEDFGKFEAPPPANARGRYGDEPTIQVIYLSESEHVDFSDDGGVKDFNMTIALYYRFSQGLHRGRQTSSGFFALFDLTGKLSYRHLDNDEFELAKSQVTAEFKGFSRSLAGPGPEDESQAE